MRRERLMGLGIIIALVMTIVMVFSFGQVNGQEAATLPDGVTVTQEGGYAVIDMGNNGEMSLSVGETAADVVVQNSLDMMYAASAKPQAPISPIQLPPPPKEVKAEYVGSTSVIGEKSDFYQANVLAMPGNKIAIMLPDLEFDSATLTVTMGISHSYWLSYTGNVRDLVNISGWSKAEMSHEGAPMVVTTTVNVSKTLAPWAAVSGIAADKKMYVKDLDPEAPVFLISLASDAEMKLVLPTNFIGTVTNVVWLEAIAEYRNPLKWYLPQVSHSKVGPPPH